MNQLRPVNNNVLIKQIKNTTTNSGLELPPKEGDTAKGVIVACDVHAFNSGDTVFYKNWNAVEIEHEGEKFHVVEAKDIKLVLQDSQIPAGPGE